MAALTQPRMQRFDTWKNVPLVLAAGATVFTNGMACFDTANQVVAKGSVSTTLVRCGEFLQSLDNSASGSTAIVMVNLDKEVLVRWYDNDTVAPVTLALLYTTNVFIKDDHTVTATSSGHSSAGRLLFIDPVKGIGVIQPNL